ncbi:MAG: PAS domain-containing sensor histidine kinase [Planctomycetaceae bacterium]
MNPATSRQERPPAAGAPAAGDVAAILRDTATLWETIWRTSGEFIVVIDAEGIIRACNRVEEGFTLDQVVGHSLVRVTLPESSAALLEIVRQVFHDGQTRSVETTVRRLDGGLSYFALRVAPIRRDERIVAAMVCCENIRPLKDTEQALTHERNVLSHLLEIQERERQLVSYEIHDGLTQYVAGALMHLQAYDHGRERGADARRDFEQGLRLLEVAAAEARRLIAGLRPPALDELGIVAAVESLVAEARADVPDVAFTHSLPARRLPPQLETVIFRIVQEALTNVRKHAAARHVSVTLQSVADRVLVRVVDDGRGFDPAAVPETRFGLEGIRQRCRLLGGEPRITSGPGAGTTIEATLPIPTGD